jgi:alpha-L-rhamnosidase
LDNWESIPTDCPTREKLGWTCDGSITEESALYNFDADRFYRKWQHDLEDAQDASGHVPAIVPTPGWGKSPGKNLPGVYSCPWWGGAIVRVPWTLYQFGGDRRQLALAYPAMKAYVDFIGKTSPNFIVTWGLGDWLDESADVGVKRTMGQRKAPLWLTSTAAYYL